MTSTSEISSFRMAPPPAAFYEQEGPMSQSNYAAFLKTLCINALGDSVTRVVDVPVPTSAKPSSSVERQPSFRRDANGVVVVAMTHYSDFQDFVGSREKLEALTKEIPTARAVVFDLRPAVTPSESEQGMASYSITSSGVAGELTTV